MRRMLLAALCVLGLVSGASAQQTLYSGYLRSRPNTSTSFRNMATSAGAAQISDSTDWISTSGWTRATIQHIGTDTYAADSVSYTIFARWSNDGSTSFLSDSLPLEDTENSANLDTLIIRPAAFVRFCLWSHATPGSPRAAGNYATVSMLLCAKGGKQ